MNGQGTAILSLLRSRTLTVWLVGLFIIYYLTMAVWVGEAFGRYVIHLSSNNLFRAFYLLFFVNVLCRTVDALRALWRFRARFFLQAPLLLGLVIFLFSFFMSLNARSVHWSPPLGRGDAVTIPREGLSYRIESVAPAIRKKAIRTNNAVIFDYEPGVTMKGADGRRYSIGAYPPQKVGSAYLHVLLFGIGPGIELKKNGDIISKGYMALRLAPFGSVDTFEIPPFPYRYALSIIPNAIVKKGAEVARSYDLQRPMYHIEIMKGDRIISQTDTETGVSFERDMSISFHEPDEWIILEIVSDPYIAWFVISLMMLILGITLYPIALWSGKK